MSNSGKIPAPDDPTEPEDWIGAAEVRPRSDPAPAEAHGGHPALLFHVYRSSVDSTLFAVLATGDTDRLPPCPKGGTWKFFKKFPATGQPRIGFSETKAREDIEKNGYHLSQVRIDIGDANLAVAYS